MSTLEGVWTCTSCDECSLSLSLSLSHSLSLSLSLSGQIVSMTQIVQHILARKPFINLQHLQGVWPLFSRSIHQFFLGFPLRGFELSTARGTGTRIRAWFSPSVPRFAETVCGDGSPHRRRKQVAGMVVGRAMESRAQKGSSCRCPKRHI